MFPLGLRLADIPSWDFNVKTALVKIIVDLSFLLLT